MKIATKNIVIKITNVIPQNSNVDKVVCRYINKSLKCQSVFGFVCIKKTAKQLAPHQFTNLLCNFIFEKVNIK